MSVYVALLASLVLHLAVILAPEWIASRPPPPRQPRIEVSLPPLQGPAPAPVENVSTEPASTAAAQNRSDTPVKLQGDSLRRAQTALTHHLYYPPEAVAKGIEGEVTLLLVLDDAGRISRVDIARSSGHPILDDAAVDAARHLGRLPGARRQTLFPIRFRLD